MVAPQTSSGWPAERVQAFMRFLLSTELPCRLDPRRCYVTGHSMGGSGALNAGTTGCFAAVAPVAAGGRDVSGLKGVPVWLFHGANDAVLPVRCSESAAASLKALNGEALVKYTRYEVAPDPPGCPHATGHASHARSLAIQRCGRLHTWCIFRAPVPLPMSGIPVQYLNKNAKATPKYQGSNWSIIASNATACQGGRN